MIVAGFGFRSGATLAALQDALARAAASGAAASGAAAGKTGGITHLATLATKSGALGPLAQALDLPVIALEHQALRGVPTLTRSGRVQAMFGTGSVAEAAALVAAGPGARLRGPRAVSADGTVTAAIAEGTG